MNCKHCGQELPANARFCPNCAEPVMTEKLVKFLEKNEDENIRTKVAWANLKQMLMCTPLIAISGAWLSGLYYLVNDKPFSFKTMAIVAVLMSIAYIAICAVALKHRPERRKSIEYQFQKDQTSICPRCGSHDIMLGRKGYDWNKAYWYRMFGFKGGHYIAGMDSRKVTCQCQLCKYRWTSNREWLK